MYFCLYVYLVLSLLGHHAHDFAGSGVCYFSSISLSLGLFSVQTSFCEHPGSLGLNSKFACENLKIYLPTHHINIWWPEVPLKFWNTSFNRLGQTKTTRWTDNGFHIAAKRHDLTLTYISHDNLRTSRLEMHVIGSTHNLLVDNRI